jgi:hypothetical protein
LKTKEEKRLSSVIVSIWLCCREKTGVREKVQKKMKGGGGQWTVVVASLVMVVVLLAAMPQTAQAKAATDPRLAVLASCLNAVKLTGVRPETCNKTVSDLVTVDVFEAMFNHRNDPTAHAQGFWTFDSFMDAAKIYEPLGFGSIGGLDVQNRELAAFFAHVAHSTSCTEKKKPSLLSLSLSLSPSLPPVIISFTCLSHLVALVHIFVSSCRPLSHVCLIL